MSSSIQRIAVIVAAACCCASTGCAFLHNFKPHRLKRWNHGVDGTPASDYSYLESAAIPESTYFASVSDPEAERAVVSRSHRTLAVEACPSHETVPFTESIATAAGRGKTVPNWLATGRRMLYL